MKKPMLLSNDKFDLKGLDYTNDNWYISIKRDGVRAEIIKNSLFGRSLKSFKNTKLHEYFKNITSSLSSQIIIEGEIYCDGVPCREMAGICNSLDKNIPKGTKLYLFGIYHPTMTFEERYEHLRWFYNNQLPHHAYNFEVVEQVKVDSYKEVMEFYNQALKDGYEGAVLMNGLKQYKEGRVTVKQQIGYKIKPKREDDLKILAVNERFLNTNESMVNELGLSYKRNTVDNKEATSIAATFTCELPNGETTKVTITGDEAHRREIWQNKEDYIGQYAVVESMDYGTKDKLRHPTLLSIKPKN